MPMSIEEMTTQQKLQLMANLIVSVKQGIQEEFAGTDLVPSLSQIMDEMAGELGEAMQQVEQAAGAAANPTEVEPDTPQAPAPAAAPPAPPA